MLAGLLLAIGASAASAHPKGQRPVLDVTPTATGLDIDWIIAPDDARVLAGEFGFYTLDPVFLAEFEEYRDYVQSRLVVATSSRSCDNTVTGIDEVATGYATQITVECGDELASMTLKSELLLDLSPEYVHRYQVQTANGVVRGTLTDDQPSVGVDLQAGTTTGATDLDARARLEALVSGEGNLSLLFALGIAVALGMVHGLTPGHGKTLTAAYLAGARGTLRMATLLALVVALAHGVSTLALALIASGVNLVAPEKITPWLEGASALLAAGVGVLLLRGATLHRHSHDHGSKPHRHKNRHTKGPLATQPQSVMSLVAIGLVGGLIPGPEAFAVGFLAVALDRIMLGLLLIFAFSIGLALVVFAVAAIAVAAGHRLPGGDRAEAIAQRIGGVVFLVVAAILATKALG